MRWSRAGSEYANGGNVCEQRKQMRNGSKSTNDANGSKRKHVRRNLWRFAVKVIVERA